MTSQPEPGFSLSENQRAVWLHGLLYPQSSTYRMGGVCGIKGEVDATTLQQAFIRLLERHPVLCSTIHQRTGEPVAVPRHWSVVHGSEPLRMIDALDWSVTRLEEFWTTTYRKPLSFDTGPLFNCVGLLVQSSAVEHIGKLRGTANQHATESGSAYHCLLIFDAHHAIMDFLSFKLILEELRDLYQQRQAPGAGPDTQGHQFWSYVNEETDWLKSAEAAQQLATWRGLLLPPPQPADSGAGQAADILQEESAEFRKPISNDTVRTVRQFAASRGVTPYVFMLSALQVLLSAYLGRRDVCVASPHHGRPGARWRKTIGYFANVLIWRQRLRPHMSFEDLVERNRTLVLFGLRGRQPPFSWLLKRLSGEGAVSADSLTQVAFVWNTTRQTGSVTSLEFDLLHVEQGGAIYDITLTVYVTADVWTIAFGYKCQRVSEQLVQSLAANFEGCILRVAGQPDRRLGALQLIDPPDWHRTNALGTLAPDLLERSIAEWAMRAPSRIALKNASRQLTYAELETMGSALAAAIRRHTTGRAPVAVLINRGIESCVLLLSLVKLRIPYVPLNPEQPMARIRSSLQDASPQLVVSCERDLDKLRGEEEYRVVTLESLWAEIPAAQDLHGDHASAVHDGAEIAYIIYTSGSTGVPKGVAVTYNNLHHLLDSTRFCFARGSQNWSLFHHFSFDFSMWEVWGPLVHGQTLTVLSDQEVRSPTVLFDALVRNEVTHLSLTPPACQLLLTVIKLRSIRETRLEAVFLGGAALSESLAAELRDLPLEFWNFYGPTEATVWSTCCPLDHDAERIRIGFPLAGTHAYVLDDDLEWVPEHAVGELYIGGPQVAEYFKNPSLTAAHFTPDPWRDGARMYKTGDRARYSIVHGLEFVGRQDRQIKFRGYRVELGDIEAAVTQLPLVRQAVCAASSESCILAFYTSITGEALDRQALDRLSREVLPHYVYPLQFVWMRELPLNANHKLDVTALERSIGPESREPAKSESEANELTEVILSVWRQVLGTESIDSDANFFDLGGSSLMLVKVHELLVARLPTPLSVLDLYTYPKVRALARLLSSRSVSQKPETSERRGAAQLQRRWRRREKMAQARDRGD